MGIKGYMVQRVQESAAAYGGQCTHTFSQVLEPVSGMIGKSKVTSGGICQALSEMWIAFHAHDGALWNWLCPGGNISSSAWANIAYNFKYGSVRAGDTVTILDNQDVNSDLWFLQYGIRRRSSIVPQMSVTGFAQGRPIRTAFSNRSLTEGRRAAGVSRGGLGIKLAKDLTSGAMVKNMGQGDGTYRMIGIFGSSDAHCMCAFVGTDVAFFDPNFGEFHFNSRAEFATWFGEVFWKRSFYDWALNQSYSIRDYARAVGAGHANLTGKF